MPNISFLCDKYGSDKGSIKHNYSRIYDMIFYPYKDKNINFLELGLLIGGPEHNIDKNRITDDLPSIRIWLDYFSKAQIIGLDISDFSWFQHDRFRFVQCDMDQRENIKRAANIIGEVDIIIDDASHASHHQQFALLELWNILRPGGLYIIEDLQWQPAIFERFQYPKTSNFLFQFSINGYFDHIDKDIEFEFNSISDQIGLCHVFGPPFTVKKKASLFKRESYLPKMAILHKLP